MYAGTTLTRRSGNVLGGHQKIDRVARRNLERLMPGARFPRLKQILHFEGNNGPDAIKRKSPAQDEPWHFFQPFDLSDTQILQALDSHYRQLVTALKKCDMVRAAFEAAWLAHAMVDGLTPAHHYPYEEKVTELRGGKGIETRNSFKEKVLFPGDTLRQQAHNNWQYWGPKGLFSTHTSFEWGVSTVMLPLRMRRSLPIKADITALKKQGMAAWFRAEAQAIASLQLYEDFYEHGWTIRFSRRVKRDLAPRLVRAVSVAWAAALQEASAAESSK